MKNLENSSVKNSLKNSICLDLIVDRDCSTSLSLGVKSNNILLSKWIRHINSCVSTLVCQMRVIDFVVVVLIDCWHDLISIFMQLYKYSYCITLLYPVYSLSNFCTAHIVVLNVKQFHIRFKGESNVRL